MSVTARAGRRPRREQETIEELFGDVIGDTPCGLYDPDPVEAAPAEAAPARSGFRLPQPSEPIPVPHAPIPHRRAPDRRARDPAPEGRARAPAPEGRARAPSPDADRPAARAPDPSVPAEGPAGHAEALERIRRGRARRGDGGGGGGGGRGGGFDPLRRGGALRYRPDNGLLSDVVLWKGLATVLTFGLWRFWLVAEARRAVWSHTELDGDGFEWGGTGRELALGFLMAVVFLAGIMAVANLSLVFAGFVALDPAAIQPALAMTGVLATLPLMPYARFRARRYQAARTRWRGIRFGLTGSGLGLVARWALWQPAVALTLGLALPFWRVARERHLTNAMHWGDARFSFHGSAWALMPRWTVLWLVLAAPFAVTGLAGLHDMATEGAPLARAGAGASLPPVDTAGILAGGLAGLGEMEGRQLVSAIGTSGPAAFCARLVEQALASPGLLALAALLWTAALGVQWLGYRGREIRLFMEGRRVAGVTFASRFSGGDLIAAWLAVAGRWLWPGILVSIAIGVLAGVPLYAAIGAEMTSLGALGGDTPPPDQSRGLGGFSSWRAQGLMAMSLLISYGLSSLFTMWLWMYVFFARVHGALCARTEVRGIESLEAVHQAPRDESRQAEGFADALELGAI